MVDRGRRGACAAMAAACIAGLAGCAARPVEPATPIRSIAIVPPAAPVLFTAVSYLTTGGFGMGLLNRAMAPRNAELTARMNQLMPTRPDAVAQALVEALADTLRRAGHEVEVLSPERGSDGRADATKPATQADAVLHLRLSTVGLQSPAMATQALPWINADGWLLERPSERYRWQGVVYFGADARPNTSWSIEATPAQRYPSIEIALGAPDALSATFDRAARAIGTRMGEQISAALR